MIVKYVVMFRETSFLCLKWPCRWREFNVESNSTPLCSLCDLVSVSHGKWAELRLRRWLQCPKVTSNMNQIWWVTIVNEAFVQFNKWLCDIDVSLVFEESLTSKRNDKAAWGRVKKRLYTGYDYTKLNRHDSECVVNGRSRNAINIADGTKCWHWKADQTTRRWLSWWPHHRVGFRSCFWYSVKVEMRNSVSVMNKTRYDRKLIASSRWQLCIKSN